MENHFEKVSIIVPVYNAGKYIEDTIRSVMSQSYLDWELILVDDYSEDSSVEVIGQFLKANIILLKNDIGKGAAAARNKGMEAATGRYIAFLDADDIWDPKKLEKQVQFMEENQCAFSFTGYEFAGEDGIGVDKIVRIPSKMKYRAALKNTTIFTSTVMVDLEKLSLDLVKMPLVASEDTATWWQILRAGYTAFGLDEALTLYRRSSDTLSSNKMQAIERIWNLYRNVEKLSVVKSGYYFAFYAIHAVMRRI